MRLSGPNHRFFRTVFLGWLFFLGVLLPGQQRFPGNTWDRAASPEELGYSLDKLQAAERFARKLKTAAVVVVVDGVILIEWGEVDKKFMTHSTRKSFLSALYGNYVRGGRIDLDKSMGELGIDDAPPLTEVEKRATIRDCIQARSGVYHPALYESAGMKALKPSRHSHEPGSFWYYNNWDFNVLGTIFEKLTGNKIFEALETEIARPIGMEHFTADDGWYVSGEDSIHRAYPFRITARDMARFGLLMLRGGDWNGRRIIPEDWVKESTTYRSDAALYGCDGYGYMWWVVKHGNRHPHIPGVNLSEGAYSARGAGGHYIFVIPSHDMVVVHRVNTYKRGQSVSAEDVGRLLNMILESKLP